MDNNDNCMFGIVILNYNTCQETIDCVASIIQYTKARFKIYIVDNKSTDESLTLLRDRFALDPTIRVIESQSNRGYSAGNNIGIHAAIEDGCDLIFIVNSDVELLNNAFDIMAKTLLKDDSYMMIGPSVENLAKKESQLPRSRLTYKQFVFDRHPFINVPQLRRMTNRLCDSNGKSTFVFEGSVSGCCFGIRTEDFVSVNLFDENVFLYYEEDILAYKMAQHNKLAVVDYTAKVVHKENVSTNKQGTAFVRFYRWTSVFYLLRTYVKIGMLKSVFVAIWNVLTWLALSIKSVSYRRLAKDFCEKNWQILTGQANKLNT